MCVSYRHVPPIFPHPPLRFLPFSRRVAPLKIIHFERRRLAASVVPNSAARVADGVIVSDGTDPTAHGRGDLADSAVQA